MEWTNYESNLQSIHSDAEDTKIDSQIEEYFLNSEESELAVDRALSKKYYILRFSQVPGVSHGTTVQLKNKIQNVRHYARGLSK